MVDRRTFLKTTGTASVFGLTGLAGCLGEDGNGNGNGNGDANGNGVGSGNGNQSGNGDGNETGNGNGDGNETGNGNGDGNETGNGNGNGESLPDTLEFLMSPSDPQEEMEAQYGPMAEHLSSELGSDVSLTYSNNYSAVISALGSGTGHIGEMGPFAAALGVRSGDLNIILQRYAYGGWTYPSVMVTREDTDIESLEDIEGKTVAFADRLSASGALVPLHMLMEAGLDVGDYPSGEGGADFDATFSSHAEAIEQLNAGTVDAAGVGMFAAVVDGDEEREEYLDGIELVNKREGLPRAPICVSPTLSEENQNAIQQAFLDAPDEAYEGSEGADGEVYELWFSDVREADSGTYDEVVQIANDLGIEADLLDESA